jgi:hypothetical protein
MPSSDRATFHTAAWPDVPLPGLHKCLTWQLNVTLHPELHSAKWVSVLRDPDVQVEIDRVGTGLQADLHALETLAAHLDGCLQALRYLGGLPSTY